MSLWTIDTTIEALNDRSADTLASHCGIVFTEVGADYLKAKMPIDARTRQPIGIMHGGASCVLAETVGSTAANLCVNQKTHYCVGLSIYTNHIRSVRLGWVLATTQPDHIGRSTHVWNIEIQNEDGKCISLTRLTMAVLNREV